MAIGDPSTQGEGYLINNGNGAATIELTWGHPDVIVVSRPSAATGKLTINLPVMSPNDYYGYGHVLIAVQEVGTGGVDLGPATRIAYAVDTFTRQSTSSTAVNRTRADSTAVRGLEEGEVIAGIFVAGSGVGRWYLYGDSANP